MIAGGGSGAAAREDVQADVAAHLGPFVVLLGQDRAGEADRGVAVGEDADDVGAAADFAVESFLYPALAVVAGRAAIYGRRSSRWRCPVRA